MNPAEHNTAESMDTFYRDADDSYHEDRSWFYSLVAQYASKATAGRVDLDVMDVGCGRGDQLRHLRSWFGSRIRSATGIDISMVAISKAEFREPWAKFAIMDVVRPRSDWHYDLIVCSQTLEHIFQAERALESMIAMLRPGGQLLLTVPDGVLDSYAGHYHFWTLDSFAELLRPWSGSVERLTDHHLVGEVRK